MKTVALIAALLLPAAVLAQDVAGRFDYYVLSLSWSPSWCRAEGDADDAAQCAPGRRTGFVVHGLWPQYTRGWPENCRSAARDPSRRETGAMADIMGSGGLAWYQWQKHGRCTGLTARDYFALTRAALAEIELPATLQGLGRDITLPSRVVEDAFIEVNPDLARDGITVTCRDRALQEVRICLTRDLEPRACAQDASRDCSGSFLMPATR
ncbi:ribonuclease T2 [Paracoccus halophilus]|uniref:Ribonuclease T n=1 Tax=Paracoccus halophilus TaxID=376733 RepID=A0A099F1F0_9RHOB|nr:ribonuclease T2 [Paracoccus halophilus]KGJ04500.1 ribonuclease T [Paracoccus halophilus]SFA54571.1 ribonuclease T2 [Paracoccus halophilus]